MTDIDINLMDWGKQSGELRKSGSSIEEIGNAASATMSGNPYGCFTPIFRPRYDEVAREFRITNSSLGRVLDVTAQAVDDSVSDFRAVEEKIENGKLIHRVA